MFILDFIFYYLTHLPYSICQSVMRIPITNKTYISQSFVLAFSSFSGSPPSIFFSLKERNIKGYSDALSYACSTVTTLYLNLIVERFDHTTSVYLKLKMKQIFPVRALLLVLKEINLSFSNYRKLMQARYTSYYMNTAGIC